MPKRNDISCIMVIGSGPIVIGQACEFDYSGTQAVKALKEEGYKVVLINSNPATIMTDPELADRTYIEPMTANVIERILEKEKPDVILPTIGGQTALNIALELERKNILAKHGVGLIGANIEAITRAEYREKFKEVVAKCGLESARSFLANTKEEANKIMGDIGFPLIIRPSGTLGGSGGAIVNSPDEFDEKISWGFEMSPVNELLIEESLLGWKEFELEVMRDRNDNAVIICSIENLDPMGVHTGDSITVAPAQTLTDKEYQNLRDAALKLLRATGVETGGSNVQFAVCPRTGRQIVIEMNPRVSRSSALASKATGFPIAKIAAKLAVGYTLDELINDITKKTPSCFEPSIDYVVVKVPRFTFEKFFDADRSLGTQMKSVGEVMSIGRTFCESFQKACRSLEEGRVGFLGDRRESSYGIRELKEKLPKLLPERPYLVGRAIEVGMKIREISELTGYDVWWLAQFERIVELELELKNKKLEDLSAQELRFAKQLGESDARIAQLVFCTEAEVRKRRHELGLRPSFKSVDTCAAEFESYTPYLYSNWDPVSDPKMPDCKRKIAILGGGPNRIGQGIEFDYCCVHASFALRDAGIETIMINCNPETVSTDYDTSDRLYFEPLTLEDVLEIMHFEGIDGVIVQYGGQTPLKLAEDLIASGVSIIGTSPSAIEMAENRELFRDLLQRLDLKQAENGTARNLKEAMSVAKRIGFPLMVRPSFVLGGRAMMICPNEKELEKYIEECVSVSHERPVLIDRFLSGAIEVDVDAVCDGTEVLIAGIVEHIERAGIHSGDSSFVLPSQTLNESMIDEIIKATKSLALEIGVNGLVNVQYAIYENELFVIEVNPRASRSVPFISKVFGIPWAKVAARVMAGESLEKLCELGLYGDLLKFRDYKVVADRINYVAVKESVFPFIKFKGVDTVLGPEMKSTGEVMGIDYSLGSSFSKALKGAGMSLPCDGRVFVSVKDSDKDKIFPLIKDLQEVGFSFVGTRGTTEYLRSRGIEIRSINKVREGSPHVVDILNENLIDLVINTPEGLGTLLDSRSIRSTATERGLPLFTTVSAARAAVDSIVQSYRGGKIEIKSLQEYLEPEFCF